MNFLTIDGNNVVSVSDLSVGTIYQHNITAKRSTWNYETITFRFLSNVSIGYSYSEIVDYLNSNGFVSRTFMFQCSAMVGYQTVSGTTVYNPAYGIYTDGTDIIVCQNYNGTITLTSDTVISDVVIPLGTFILSNVVNDFYLHRCKFYDVVNECDFIVDIINTQSSSYVGLSNVLIYLNSKYGQNVPIDCNQVDGLNSVIHNAVYVYWDTQLGRWNFAGNNIRAGTMSYIPLDIVFESDLVIKL